MAYRPPNTTTNSSFSLLAGDDDHPEDHSSHSMTSVNSYSDGALSSTIASLMSMRGGLQEGLMLNNERHSAVLDEEAAFDYCQCEQDFTSSGAAPLLPTKHYKRNNNAPKPRSHTEQIMDNIVMVAVLLAWLILALCLAWHHYHYGMHSQK